MPLNSAGTADFQCHINGAAVAFPHYWEHTVGSCHATLALRADWQRQLHRSHKELGFMHVRFHGLFCDDVGTLVCENDQLVYSFFNADQIFDFLLSIGMRPFLELSFMPSTLSSGDDIVFHYKGNVTPPRDYGKWGEFIKIFVKHLNERYGEAEVKEWFFEVWNEPNLDAFWKGTQADYFKLYQYTAEAVKAVSAQFKVGGPATADNEWISEFLDFAESNKAPVDFITTHHYPTDSFGKPGDDTISQLAQSRRSVLRDEAAAVKAKAKGKPVYYTEWCTSSNPFDDLHDLPYAAAFIIKTVMEAAGLVHGYSYWTFSDIFEENYFSSVPFHGGFGLVNIYGIPKPAYRAFQLLHGLGEALLPVSGSHPTVDIWVVKNTAIIDVMVTNWALPRHDIRDEVVRIKFPNLKAGKAYIRRIDDGHANARKHWEAIGAPGSLSPHIVQELEDASSLVKEQVGINYEDGVAFVEVTMPVQSSACITIETDG